MKVRIYELHRSTSLKEAENAINRGLAGAARVRLFRDQTGKTGYSLEGLSPETGRRTLLDLHAAAAKALGWKRGRPRGEPTRQVKLRLPESAYLELARRAAKRAVSPSRLAGQLLLKQLP